MQEKNKNITDVSGRLLLLIKYLNFNPNSFAKMLGYNRGQVIYDILNNKAKPSFDFFYKLLNADISVKINITWLITGEGPMLREEDAKSDLDRVPETPSKPQHGATQIAACPQCTAKDKIIASQEATIEAQKETIKLLKKELEACGRSKKPPLPDTLPDEVTAKLKKD